VRQFGACDWSHAGSHRSYRGTLTRGRLLAPCEPVDATCARSHVKHSHVRTLAAPANVHTPCASGRTKRSTQWARWGGSGRDFLRFSRPRSSPRRGGRRGGRRPRDRASCDRSHADRVACDRSHADRVACDRSHADQSLARANRCLPNIRVQPVWSAGGLAAEPPAVQPWAAEHVSVRMVPWRRVVWQLLGWGPVAGEPVVVRALGRANVRHTTGCHATRAKKVAGCVVGPWSLVLLVALLCDRSPSDAPGIRTCDLGFQVRLLNHYAINSP